MRAAHLAKGRQAWQRSRSGSARAAGAHTGSMTWPSSRRGAPVIPRTSRSAGRSTPSASSSRCSPRRWTASSRLAPPSRSARLGGVGVLNLEGLWTRYADPDPILEEISQLDNSTATKRMQELYAEPIKPELIGERIQQIKDAGVTTAASLTPQRVKQFSPGGARGGGRPVRHPGHRRQRRARLEPRRAAEPQEASSAISMSRSSSAAAPRSPPRCT